MRSSSLFALAIALLGIASAAAAPADPKPPQFPPPGTPYAKARAMLLAQGLQIAPDTPAKPDAKFHELDCWDPAPAAHCRALYLERDGRGWRSYIIVEVNPGLPRTFG